MAALNIIAILLTLAAIFSYVNHRVLRLPRTIGLMVIALVLSLALIGTDLLGWGMLAAAKAWVNQIDFSDTLMYGMLSFLLFAGALHVDLGELVRQKLVIGTLATVGILLSTVVVGAGAYVVVRWLGFELPFSYCLVFGALISPTDPIAVLGILKRVGAPKSLETKITGESLFNDGVGVVLFLVMIAFARGDNLGAGDVAILFAQEAGGGVALGLLLGFLSYRLLRSVDDYQIEVLISLALVTGGYALATALHLSGPIAIVVAGLFIGNHGRSFAMSERTREHLDAFWELVDEVLNAVLFVLIGLELLVLTLRGGYLLAGVVLIPLPLIARALGVGGVVLILRRFRSFSRGVVPILTWGGLRGGISVALALSLPDGAARELILVVTYVIVVFSIVVQGLTIEPLMRRVGPARAAGESASPPVETD